MFFYLQVNVFNVYGCTAGLGLGLMVLSMTPPALLQFLIIDENITFVFP